MYDFYINNNNNMLYMPIYKQPTAYTDQRFVCFSLPYFSNSSRSLHSEWQHKLKLCQSVEVKSALQHVVTTSAAVTVKVDKVKVTVTVDVQLCFQMGVKRITKRIYSNNGCMTCPFWPNVK